MIKTLLIFILITPLATYASGEGHVPHISDTIIFWVNFIVFFGFLTFVLRKPLKSIWAERKEGIEKEVLRAQRELVEANKKLEVSNAKYATLDEKTKKIKTDIFKETKLEAESVNESSRMQVEALTKHAENNIEAEKNSAKNSVQEEFAEKVYTKAKEKLTESFDKDYDKKYRKEAIEGLKSLNS